MTVPSAGTYINAFAVELPSSQPVTRIPVSSREVSRRELERLHGVALFIHEGAAWTAAPIAGQERIDIASDEHLPVHLFNLRGALLLRARTLGWDFWIHQGEVSAVRPDVRETIGPFAIQAVLNARAVWEGLQVKELLLVASSSVRWLVDLPLSHHAAHSIAKGEYVLRRSADDGGPRRVRVDGFDGDQLLFADREGATQQRAPLDAYQLVARPGLVYRLMSALGRSPQEASSVYADLLVASGTLRREDRRTPNQYAAKQRFGETEELLDAFGRQFPLASGVDIAIADTPREVFPVAGPARDPWSATRMGEPRLRFDLAIPSRSDTRAYQGLRAFGAYNLGDVPDSRLLLAFPAMLQREADSFGEKFLSGSGSYPGFARLFGIPDEHRPVIEKLVLPAAPDRHDGDWLSGALDRWSAAQRPSEPDLAIVIVPHTDRWEIDSSYYGAKEFFAQRGVPSQMVTLELLQDAGRLGWSLANIALAAFAKLGGVPWVVDAHGRDADLVIGVGRADINDGSGGRRRTFGYAVAFVSNGVYLATHSFPPASDDADYETRLTEAIVAALGEARTVDLPTERVVVHLSKRTGEREIRAAEQALRIAEMRNLPYAFLRIDDSSLFEFIDVSTATFAPPKGLTLRLGERRALVQVETLSSFGPARRPLLIEMDGRSTIGADDFGALVLQAFRLGHANWRGFNARSKPVTLLYGEQLAELVGYMNLRGTWDPATMRADLRNRPWFL